MHLKEQTNYQPYLLGRLFAVLEWLQILAVWDGKKKDGATTIRDKYFSSASATPAVVFPTLIRLAQTHIKKLDGAKRGFMDKQLGELLARIDEEYPARLSLQDQGVFQLGYYHQRYGKKEEENHG